MDIPRTTSSDPLDSQTSSKGLWPAKLLRGLLLAFLLDAFVRPTKPSQSSRTRAISIAGSVLLFVIAGSWLRLVDTYVPEPYLDEVFHIPQAQTYCAGRFWDWDDKITTPPGLYLLAALYHKASLFAECTPFALRASNLFATLLIFPLAAQCRQLIEARCAEQKGEQPTPNVSFYSYHTALNTTFFPVIFFFSALYYTDVVSTFVVLAAYRNHLLRLGSRRPSFLNDILTVVLGVFALFMRQTNVFWVVVYMGGLEAVHAVLSAKPVAQGFLSTVHDPPLNEAGPEDWVLCLLSLAVAGLRYPGRVLRQIWPHITILALFVAFVAWNGGVVLGDKSNHVATVHLAQMLYIWPLFAFFSAPLFIPSAVSLITHPLRHFRGSGAGASKLSTPINAAYTAVTLILSLAIIKYNTIIHPFTLADNRHYMFYVFRYTILRSPARRFALVAAYTLCRWLVWDTLAGKGATTSPSQIPVQDLSLLDSTSSPPSTAPPSTSTAILLFLTTALSLVTAPLVEPRYFILPWVFYRLLVPAQKNQAPLPAAGWWGWLGKLGQKYDLRLVLETVWFLAVNAGTMYMFLFRGFYWRGEDGGLLDDGRVQRFMW
ncbi:glycosyltransferase family 59 protein [Canariomyces notabilis]|uniref:Dol-P-Glc:Glc(2)Man(9)GlcNAc(2)-PP-Dol alpha-1,2-glucosyltransferase n=1 Tax=Canariomyces notabilis TaxID=2074819 RepID=A0AAN6TAS9_9PEZI|nr:glycosyltransferase family 59 protein [Canariomyces arenarius]